MGAAGLEIRKNEPVIALVADRRRNLLVLWMNPQRNVAAVACRDLVGVDAGGSHRAVIQDLMGQEWPRLRWLMSLTEVDSAVLADLNRHGVAPGWRHLKHFNGWRDQFLPRSSDITSEHL